MSGERSETHGCHRHPSVAAMRSKTDEVHVHRTRFCYIIYCYIFSSWFLNEFWFICEWERKREREDGWWFSFANQAFCKSENKRNYMEERNCGRGSYAIRVRSCFDKTSLFIQAVVGIRVAKLMVTNIHRQAKMWLEVRWFVIVWWVSAGNVLFTARSCAFEIQYKSDCCFESMYKQEKWS